MGVHMSQVLPVEIQKAKITNNILYRFTEEN